MFSASGGLTSESGQASKTVNTYQKKYIYSVGREIVGETWQISDMNGASPVTYSVSALCNLPGLTVEQQVKLHVVHLKTERKLKGK